MLVDFSYAPYVQANDCGAAQNREFVVVVVVVVNCKAASTPFPKQKIHRVYDGCRKFSHIYHLYI